MSKFISSPSVKPLGILAPQTSNNSLRDTPININYIQVNESKETFEKQFLEYFSALSEIEHKLGDPEPLCLKSIRPFLLPSENIKSNIAKGSKRKGKGKGKQKKGDRINLVIAKVYTASNPPPAMSNYSSSNKPYRFTQTVASANTLTTSTTLPTFVSYYFYLNQLDQVSNLQSVFDQYMIEYVELWFEPAGNSPNNSGQLYTVVDYDDANNLTSINQAADYSNAMVSNINDGHYRRFRPHVAVATYSGSFTSYGNSESMWIDMASAAVQHFGVKVAASVSFLAASYTVRSRFHIACRNIR
jgi:hypothetical protein